MLGGTLTHGGKDVELRVDLNRATGVFSVNPSGLLENKLKAAQLSGGMSGADLLANLAQRAASAEPSAQKLGGSSAAAGAQNRRAACSSGGRPYRH